MQCVSEGHTMVALANLRPKDKGLEVYNNFCEFYVTFYSSFSTILFLDYFNIDTYLLVMLTLLYYTDELDSYMYQTVGHHAIDLYSEALNLPLYRHTIEGSSIDTNATYHKTTGDEVEDLFQLLCKVKVCIS